MDPPMEAVELAMPDQASLTLTMALQKRSNDEMPSEGPSPKKRRAEPDVTVVVGTGENAETFYHYSHILCFASDFFDAALHSGMKESNSMRFEFPDRCPQEWKFFASLLEPCSSAKLTLHNVEDLIPWFHHFRVLARFEECEELYKQKLVQVMALPSFSWSSSLDLILEKAAFCRLYDMSETQNWIMQVLNEQLLQVNPTCLLDKPENIPNLLNFVQQDLTYCKGLWNNLVVQFLPADVIDQIGATADTTSMLENKMLPLLLRMGIERLSLENQQTSLKQAVKDFPRRLGHALPKGYTVKNNSETISAMAVSRLEAIMKNSCGQSL
jgi:hypothetical protein